MPHYQTTRRVNHPARQMYDLVLDAERYPEFVPYCTGLKVLRRSVAPDGRKTMVAAMTVGYGPISETFTTRVTMDEDRLKLLIQYVDGPFRHLENRWSFVETGPDSSQIEFFIDYSFKSRTFELLAGSVFERLFRKMADAFVARADTLSGAPQSDTSA